MRYCSTFSTLSASALVLITIPLSQIANKTKQIAQKPGVWLMLEAKGINETKQQPSIFLL